MKKSAWQTGIPPCDGIWEIDVVEHGMAYYARFKDGTWGVGETLLNRVPTKQGHWAYSPNNHTMFPRRWRGRID